MPSPTSGPRRSRPRSTPLPAGRKAVHDPDAPKPVDASDAARQERTREYMRVAHEREARLAKDGYCF